jgi:tetratricopeptide (TPR) repeat protein
MENKRHIEMLKTAAHYQRKKNLSAALDMYSKVIEEDSSCTEAYFNMANIFHLRGEIGKAIKMFQRVLELDPHHADASIGLSVLLNDIGRYEEAQQVFEKANDNVKHSKSGIDDLHLNRKFSAKHYELAEMYYSYARMDEALFEYNKAMGLNPDNLDIRIKVAKVYAKKGFTSKAFEELKKLKNEYPAYIPAKMALGLLYFEGGNIIEAKTQWQNVLAQDASNNEAQMYLQLSDTATETTI